MKLRDLLTGEARFEPRFGALDIHGISADSRAVTAGFLFAAVPGTKADGLAFLPQALAAGASAVMAERAPPDPLPDHVAFVEVANVRRALALAAASIGTVGVVTPTREVYGSLTTPDPVELHRTLDGLAGEGVTHLALEASSHGLDQHRLDGVRVGIASFTNISRDHLDYHGTIEAYFQAKMILFERLVHAGGAAVVAADNELAGEVAARARRHGLRVIEVGRSGRDVRLVDCAINGFSQRLTIAHAGATHRVCLPLVGAFQVENALVAAGQALAAGGDPEAVFAALEGLTGAKGRLELVGRKAGAPIFVDYAHKPDALAKALEALRPYVGRRLVVVFGAGGDRDAGKRPLMGAIAAAKADRVIVTDDNPRSEDPAAIRAAIMTAAPGAGEVPDRNEAIRSAVAALERGDVLLIAGKGHETGQIIGHKIVPFSDHEAVATALATQANLTEATRTEANP
jgi:UDP-N-acetylmuramoyl-L-alanyl-D-glutamate--2,6-diaminopimelate ligase